MNTLGGSSSSGSKHKFASGNFNALTKAPKAVGRAATNDKRACAGVGGACVGEPATGATPPPTTSAALPPCHGPGGPCVPTNVLR